MSNKKEIDEMKSKSAIGDGQIEKKGQSQKSRTIVIVLVLAVCIVAALVAVLVVIPKVKYAKAKKLLASKDYEAAYDILRKLGKEDEIKENKQSRASDLVLSKEYEAAYILLGEIGREDLIYASKYSRAVDYLLTDEYEKAYVLFDQIGKKEEIVSSKNSRAAALIASGDYEAAYSLYKETGNDEAIIASKNDRAAALIASEDYEAAYALYEEIGNKDAIVSNKYDRAVALFDSGDYEAARILFEGLDYKDSVSKLNAIKVKNQIDSMTKAKVGEYVFFGSYEQDNDLANGKEDIEWLVVEKKENKILLLSKYALDSKPYNETNVGITWETCTLRAWLNSTFLNDAFNAEEQRVVADSSVQADKNYKFGTSGGKNTIDKVFLLSRSDLIQLKYFIDNGHKGMIDPYEPLSWSCYVCQGTAYCYAQGAEKNEKGNCCWWVRTPGDVQNSAVAIYYDGKVFEDGIFCYIAHDAVRPAIWVNLEP